MHYHIINQLNTLRFDFIVFIKYNPTLQVNPIYTGVLLSNARATTTQRNASLYTRKIRYNLPP